MSTELASVEIFAGGGGMALGMRRVGFEHKALVEWWRPAIQVLRHNAILRPSLWQESTVLGQDVRETFDRLSELSDVDLVAGGPPCQPFSLAGAHAGHSDDRNMFPAAIEIVRRLRPKYVVFENVPGLTRPTFAPFLDYVRDQLRAPDVTPRDDELWNEHHARVLASNTLDYFVYQFELDAADLGVAQNRKRVFLVAVRRDVPGAERWKGVEKTHSRDRLLFDQWVTGEYWDRFGLSRESTVPKRLLGHVNRIRHLGVDSDLLPWRTLRELLSEMPEPTVEAGNPLWPNHYSIPGARTYLKHNGSPLDLPSKTIKAGVHGIAGGEGMLRELDGTVRYLSIREAAMVQGFPQDYEFPGIRSRMMGVIGNAVAVDVAAAVGRALINLEPKPTSSFQKSLLVSELTDDGQNESSKRTIELVEEAGVDLKMVLESSVSGVGGP